MPRNTPKPKAGRKGSDDESYDDSPKKAPAAKRRKQDTTTKPTTATKSPGTPKTTKGKGRQKVARTTIAKTKKAGKRNLSAQAEAREGLEGRRANGEEEEDLGQLPSSMVDLQKQLLNIQSVKAASSSTSLLGFKKVVAEREKDLTTTLQTHAKKLKSEEANFREFISAELQKILSDTGVDSPNQFQARHAAVKNKSIKLLKAYITLNNAAVGIARSQLSLGESWEQDAEDAAAEITEMAENVEEVIRMILVGEKGSLAEAVDKEKKGVQRLLRYVPVDVDDDEAT